MRFVSIYNAIFQPFEESESIAESVERDDPAKEAPNPDEDDEQSEMERQLKQMQEQVCTLSAIRSFPRFCKMFSKSSTVVMQLHCYLGK